MPVFHTFTAGGKRYMFDANTNVIINLKEDLYFELEKYMQSGYKEITPAIEKLRDRGYLKDRADFEMVHPMDSTLEYSLERCIGTIALQVTQGCNLRCKYCAQGTNMIKTKNISEMLTSLIEEYRFNKNTLSKYLEITEETVD